MKRAFVAVVCLLVVTITVSGEHVGMEPTNVPQSECYTCHEEGGGGLGPRLIEMFRIITPGIELAPGETDELDVEVRNWWVSELSEIVGRMDLSEAPAFAFADTPVPLRDQVENGELPFNLAAIGNSERTDRITFEVPVGGTDLMLRLVPGNSAGAQAPDLELRVWLPGENPDTRNPRSYDQVGAGETERANFAGNPVPAGTWTIEVAQPGIISSPDQSQLAAQPYQLVWDLLYEYDDPIRFASSNAVLDGQELSTPQSTTLTWGLRLDDPITEPQRIRIDVTAASFYDHPDAFGAVDNWLYIVTSNIEIEPPVIVDPGTNNTPPVQIGGDTGGTGPDLDEGGISMAVWSEIIGYFAGFLLVFSLVTGGTFGNWSRRLQQWVLFKKAKRRIAFHNLISYSLIVASVAHMVLFLVEGLFPWSLGFLLGGISLLGMLLAGATGAFQMAMVRAIGYEGWRWLHWMTFVIALGGAAAHIALDGVHFADFQETVGWEDPARPWLDELIPPTSSVQT